MSQDEEENGEAHPLRCIPEFLPCNCKNEKWKTELNKIYPPCNEDIGEADYGMAYLCVHNHLACMEAYNYDLGSNDYIAGLCMPDEKPDNCEEGTWEELGKYKEKNNYGYPIDNCTEMMLQWQDFNTITDLSETDEWGEIILNGATGPDVLDLINDEFEPDFSNEDDKVTESDVSDGDDDSTETDVSNEDDDAPEPVVSDEVDEAPEPDVSD